MSNASEAAPHSDKAGTSALKLASIVNPTLRHGVWFVHHTFVWTNIEMCGKVHGRGLEECLK